MRRTAQPDRGPWSARQPPTGAPACATAHINSNRRGRGVFLPWGFHSEGGARTRGFQGRETVAGAVECAAQRTPTNAEHAISAMQTARQKMNKFFFESFFLSCWIEGSERHNGKAGNQLEVPHVECHYIEAKMQGCSADDEVFNGDGNTLGRLLAFNASGKLGDCQSQRMHDQVMEDALHEDATAVAVGVTLGTIDANASVPRR